MGVGAILTGDRLLTGISKRVEGMDTMKFFFAGLLSNIE